ncbi:MAG: nucleotidyl transferase AbiEii/AbiGii toxin family protein [Pseudomonadota bacterium]
MILADNHTKEAINRIRNEHFKGKDPQLVEKILKALTLLELLAQEKAQFTFKGGTCLLLLLKTPRRFSIDLDLIVNQRDNLLQALDNICKNDQIFTSVKEDKRPESKIPKAHYKVFYKSSINEKVAYVLVDIIEDASPYPSVITSEIRPAYFKTAHPFPAVMTPSVNCILGDKMTAFAPRTTGIKLKSDKEMEIIKQLFDVASLFDHATDFKEVEESFIYVVEKELKYRGLAHSYEDVLQDSFDAAKIIGLRGTVEKEIHSELKEGVNKLKGYIFQPFGDREAHICAAKVAYLAQALLKKHYSLIKFTGEDVAQVEIKNPDYNKLNKIKAISPEAFWYWHQAINLMS